jgi:hypothetical protein
MHFSIGHFCSFSLLAFALLFASSLTLAPAFALVSAFETVFALTLAATCTAVDIIRSLAASLDTSNLAASAAIVAAVAAVVAETVSGDSMFVCISGWNFGGADSGTAGGIFGSSVIFALPSSLRSHTES